MKVYLCGAINGCSDSEAKIWRKEVLKVFPESINPLRRDYRGVEDRFYREIVDLDKKDIRECDLLLAKFLKPSAGSSMEVLYGWSLGKIVIAWCDENTGISPWIRYHSTKIVYTLEEAISTIGRMK